MGNLLRRGTLLASGSRVRKTLAEGEDWEIVNTDDDTLALAMSDAQLQTWLHSSPSAGLAFAKRMSLETCSVLQSTKGYLISSLRQGPYSENTRQIEAFSFVFCTAMESGLLEHAEDAVYLEEFGLLLPLGQTREKADCELLYGQWLTGGFAVRAASVGELSRFMSWIPRERLERFVEMAGFQPREEEEPDENAPGEDAQPAVFRQDGDLLRREQSEQAESESRPAGTSQRNLPKQNAVFTLPGRPELEQFFRENIIDVVQNREAYARMGISFPGATVLYGPPGSGKTYAVGKLVDYLGWPRFDIDSGTIGSSFIHDTSKKISGVFQAAMKAAPSVLVIDEMEAFLSQRNGGDPGKHHLEEVAEFLRRIPEATERGVLIFAMTNMLESIDPAILRRGRFDHMIKVDLASAEEVEALLKNRFQELPVENDIDIASLAKTLANRPMSDVAYVLKEAGRFAVRRKRDTIDAACIQDAVDRLPKKKEKPRIGF